jgi:hypothetical protein
VSTDSSNIGGQLTPSTNFGGNPQGFDISPALLTAFLPARQKNMVDVASQPTCDCVLKPNLLDIIRKLPRPLPKVDPFPPRIRAELVDVDRQAGDPETFKPEDNRRLFMAKRAVLARGQAARDKALGIDRLDAAPKLTAFNLGARRPAPEKLRTMKAEKLRQVVNAEPPRESITGSFRPH